MKKILKVLMALLLITVLICTAVFFHFLYGGFKYDNEIDCVNDSSLGELDKIEFRYENDDSVLIAYYTESGKYCFTSLRKKTDGDKTLYKSRFHSDSMIPVTCRTQWRRITKDLFIIYVKYEDDIEEIDSCGYTPVGTKITYTNAVGETETDWIYVVDKTKEPDNKNKFDNYDDILDFPFYFMLIY